MLSAVSPSKNVAIGDSAMRVMNGTANGIANCVAIGANAFFGDASATTIDTNGTVAIGFDSLKLLQTGQANTAIGYKTLDAELNGDKSTAVGYSALSSQSGTTGTVGNTAVGFEAGSNITTGIENTIVGAFSTISAVGGVNQTVIGSGVTGQQNNSVTLGNSSVTDVFMGSDSGALVNCSGIAFPATQVASGGANALDDYEEGNFTVTTNSDGTGGFSAEEAEYVKIGKVVHFRIVFTVNANFSSNNIGGLPFASTNSASPSSLVGAIIAMTNTSNDEVVTASVGGGSSVISFFSGSDATDTHLPNTTNATYRLEGTYFAS